jgi:hypothetical protein
VEKIKYTETIVTKLLKQTSIIVYRLPNITLLENATGIQYLGIIKLPIFRRYSNLW